MFSSVFTSWEFLGLRSSVFVFYPPIKKTEGGSVRCWGECRRHYYPLLYYHALSKLKPESDQESSLLRPVVLFLIVQRMERFYCAQKS